MLISTGVMGGKAIILSYDGPCSGDGCAQDGEYIEGQYLDMLGSIAGPENVDRILTVMDKAADVLDTVKTKISGTEDDLIKETLADMQVIVSNLKITTNSINRTSCSRLDTN